jgi:hypothetical protein
VPETGKKGLERPVHTTGRPARTIAPLQTQMEIRKQSPFQKLRKQHPPCRTLNGPEHLYAILGSPATAAWRRDSGSTAPRREGTAAAGLVAGRRGREAKLEAERPREEQKQDVLLLVGQ